MEAVGEMEGVPDKTWYRCSRCRHSTLISQEDLQKDQSGPVSKIDAKECIPYSPEKIFDIGQSIVHQEWNDVGKVITKEITSSGAQAIIVAFERLGERRLIENLIPVDESPLTPSNAQPAGGVKEQALDQRPEPRPEKPTSTTNNVGGDTSW